MHYLPTVLAKNRLLPDGLQACDKVACRYQLFIQTVVVQEQGHFMFSDKQKNRVHTVFVFFLFFFFSLCKSHNFSLIWKVVFQYMVVLSHWQTSMEHGFSINKEVEKDNILKRSRIITAKQMICSYVSSVGGISNIVVDSALFAGAAFQT